MNNDFGRNNMDSNDRNNSSGERNNNNTNESANPNEPFDTQETASTNEVNNEFEAWSEPFSHPYVNIDYLNSRSERNNANRVDNHFLMSNRVNAYRNFYFDINIVPRENAMNETNRLNDVISRQLQVFAGQSNSSNRFGILDGGGVLGRIRHSEEDLFDVLNRYNVEKTEPIKEIIDSLDDYHKREMIQFAYLLLYKEELVSSSDKVKLLGDSLVKIFEKMTKNDEYKSKCVEIALEHSTDCVDRAMFGYIKMLVEEKAYPDEGSKFSIVEAFNFEKLLLKLDRIREFAEKKVANIIQSNSSFHEDIETHLRFYDELKNELGLEFSHMYFTNASRVTENDIEECRKELSKITEQDVFEKTLENKRVKNVFERPFRKIIDDGAREIEEIYSDESTDFIEKNRKTQELKIEMNQKRIEIIKKAIEKETEKEAKVNSVSLFSDKNASKDNARSFNM